MSNEGIELTPEEIQELPGRCSLPCTDFDTQVAKAQLSKLASMSDEDTRRIIETIILKWTDNTDDVAELLDADIDKILAVTNNRMDKAYQEGFDDGIKKTMDAADSTFGAQLKEVKRQLAELKKKLDYTEADLINAKKEKSERIFNWGSERVLCEHLQFYHIRKNCEGCWQTLKEAE